MTPGGNASAGWQTRLLGFARVEPVSVFERRCRLLGKRLAGDEGEERTGPSESGGVGTALGRQAVRHAPHPPRLGSRSATPSCGRRSTPNSRRSNRPTATPAPRSTSLFADAVVAAVSGERSGERRVPEICVHVDYDTMLHGLHEHSLCETADGIPLPPETVRRLACEAAIVPIVLNCAGEVLDCGREVAGREPGPAAGVAGDVPHLRLPRLRRDLRSLRHPPRHRMAPLTDRPIWTICCLARFRRRHQDAIAGLFGQVLALCVKAGLVDAGVVAIDGTKIAANASFFANRDREQLAERDPGRGRSGRRGRGRAVR